MGITQSINSPKTIIIIMTQHTHFLACLFLALFLGACGGQNNDEAQAEIKRLKKELEDKRFEYQAIGKIVKEADEQLSDIATKKKEIDELLKAKDAVGNKKNILEKISKIKEHIGESQKTLERLEAQLASTQNENQNLQLLVKQLRADLQEKNATIGMLETKVKDLENTVAQLKQDISSQEQIIQNTKKVAEKTNEDLSKVREEKAKKEEAQRKITALLAQGDDALKFAVKSRGDLDILEGDKKINKASNLRGAEFYEKYRKVYASEFCKTYAQAYEISLQNDDVMKDEIIRRANAKHEVYHLLLAEAGKKASDKTKFSSSEQFLKACRGGFYGSK